MHLLMLNQMYLLSAACGRHSGSPLVVTIVQESQF